METMKDVFGSIDIPMMVLGNKRNIYSSVDYRDSNITRLISHFNTIMSRYNFPLLDVNEYEWECDRIYFDDDCNVLIRVWDGFTNKDFVRASLLVDEDVYLVWTRRNRIEKIMSKII